MEKRNIYIGLDVGTVSVKAAALIPQGCTVSLEKNGLFKKNRIIRKQGRNAVLYTGPYIRHAGKAQKYVNRMIRETERLAGSSENITIVCTGSGAKEGIKAYKAKYYNEFKSVAAGIAYLYPSVHTIFEIGGEKSKYILLKKYNDGTVSIADYERNGECAAGTGSFLDQQAKRLEFSIEEAGDIILSAGRNPMIAGRCSVFAKSDMIHAQQRGYKPEEVLKGLAEAIVRNFQGTITKGKAVIPNAAFIGGLAYNNGVVEEIRKQFGLNEETCIVPKEHAYIGAAGAVLNEFFEQGANGKVLYKSRNETGYPKSEKLSTERVRIIKENTVKPQEGRNYFLGIDVGSISTNFAVIDEKGNLVSGLYTMTKGRPVEVVKEGLSQIYSDLAIECEITGAGTTGSGRELIGHLIGADAVKDEITAHKTGAQFVADKYLGKKVDTIFEIGGQDSKFISISDGVVTDFSLNDACAAGTGSFLEEQAKKLELDIKGEFENLALRGEKPIKMGERCTVFMEKEIDLYLQKDIPIENIVAGLALSVVQNYLNRVVKKRKIGNTIFFQGGTAYNKSVAAAFSTVLNKEIIVPPFNGIIGAIGAALLAKENKRNGKKSSFRGWNLDDVTYSEREFICKGCSNNCTVKECIVNGEKSYWGDKCSVKYRKASKNGKQSPIASLFDIRSEIMSGIIERSGNNKVMREEGICIPNTLFLIDKMPFWYTYFKKLGFNVKIGEKSSGNMGTMGIEISASDPCYPVQLSLGHLYNACKNHDGYVFYPNVINEYDPTDSVSSFICPWGQTLPLVAQNTTAFSNVKDRLLYPNIQFREGNEFVQGQLLQFMKQFKVSKNENREAVCEAYKAQKYFADTMKQKGREALRILDETGRPFILLAGRPYNMYDFELNMHIPNKLASQYGVPVIPMDCLDYDHVSINEINDHMFWNYGRRILQAAKYARELKGSHIIYISNFKCGPDSYIRHYMEEAAGGPYLFLQLDSHANDAGVMTRIEAYLESKKLI